MYSHSGELQTFVKAHSQIPLPLCDSIIDTWFINSYFHYSTSSRFELDTQMVMVLHHETFLGRVDWCDLISDVPVNREL